MVDVQICFTLDSDREKVKSQLIDLAKHEDYKFHCCFLPKKIVKENNMDSWIADMFDEVLGDRIVYTLDSMSTNLKEALDQMYTARILTANTVNKLFILDSKDAKGIQDEVTLFTSQKVIYMG